MAINSKVKKLYDALKTDGADVGTPEQFNAWFFKPGKEGYKNRKSVYDTFKADGAEVGDSYETFGKWLGLHATTPTVDKYRKQMFNSVDPTKNKASELTRRAVSQAKRATNTVRQPVKGSVVNKQGKKVEEFDITPAKTLEDLNREYAQEVTKDWEKEQNRQSLNSVYGQQNETDVRMSQREHEVNDGYQEGLERILSLPDAGLSSAAPQYDISDKRTRILLDQKYKQYQTEANLLKHMQIQLEREQSDSETPSDSWTKKSKVVEGASNFVHGIIDSTIDPYTWDLGGAKQMRDADVMLDINNRIQNGTATEDDKRIMQLLYDKQQIDSQYGDRGNMYRFGQIFGQSAPFMADFVITGGGLPQLGKMGAKYGAKLAAKAIGEEAAKSFGNRLAKWAIKNTGRTLGDLASSAILSSTVQAGKTYSDIANRYLGLNREDGGLETDKNGDIKFKGGDSVGTAIYKGIASSTIENYTEMLGEYFPALSKVALKAADMLGLKKLSRFFNEIGSSALYKGGNAALHKAGISSYFGESMEEEAGILLNSIFTGDNSLSDFNVFTNKDARRQQLDIWGGMMFSVGLMRAPLGPTSVLVNRTQYFAAKHTLKKADVLAKQTLGEKWADIKQKFDDSTNDNIRDVQMEVLDSQEKGDISREQAEAAIAYSGQLIKLRGLNTKFYMDSKEQTEKPDENQQQVGNAYAEGQSAEGETKHMIQTEYIKQQKALAAALGVKENELEAMSDEQVATNLGMDDNLDLLIFNYQKAKAAYDGVMDNSNNIVDLAGAVAEQRASSMVNIENGNVVQAMVKAPGVEEDYPVYVVSGSVATHDDGSVNVHDSDKMIVVYNEKTGQRETMPVSWFASISTVSDNADEFKAQAIQQAKEQAVKEQSRDIDGRIEEGSSFSMEDSEGNTHQYAIGEVDEAAGTCVVTVDGITLPEPMPIAKLQKQRMQSDETRSAQNDQTTQEAGQTQQEEQQNAQPIVDNYPYGAIENEDQKGTIIQVENEDADGKPIVEGAQQVFLVQDKGFRPTYVGVFEDGKFTEVHPKKFMYKALQMTSLDEFKKQRQAELAAQQQIAAENENTSAVEDNSGESVQEHSNDVQPLSEVEADNVISQMEKSAEVAPELELTPNNWIAEFGEDGIVSTPLGDVKMGENQVAKLFEKGRSKEFGMIKPTLTNPDVIIEVPSHSADGNEERASSYLFIKTFLGKNGEKVYYFKSVTIKKDGLEISVSSHYDRAKRVKNALMKGKLLYRKNDGAQTEQNQPSASVTTSQEGVAGSSEGKDTNISSNDNGNNTTLTFEDGSPIPVDEEGIADPNQMDAKHAAEYYDTAYEEDAEQVLTGFVSQAKSSLNKAQNMKIKGKNNKEMLVSREAKKNAIAMAQAELESSTSILDAYNERMLAKEESTPEGRMNLIEKAKAKFNRLKNTDEWKNQTQALWNNTIGSLLHRLYDKTSVNVFDHEPQTVEEYVSSYITPYSLNFDGTDTAKGVKQETGLERKNFAKSYVLAAEGKGQTVDDFVHKLWENRPSQFENVSDQDVRNALINLITSDMNAYDMQHVIENNRIAQAEKEIEDDKANAENATNSVSPENVTDNTPDVTAESASNNTENGADNVNDGAETEQLPSKLKEVSEESSVEVPEDSTPEQPLGKQKTKVPFSKKQQGKKKPLSREEREKMVQENSTERNDVIDAVIGKKLRKAINAIGKKSGIKIQFLASADQNGWYSNGTLYLSLNSREAMQQVFGHEMTHAIKSANADYYKELRNLTKKELGANQFRKWFKKYKKDYKGIDGYRTREDYEEELVADFVGYFIDDLNLAHSLAFKMSHPLLSKFHDIALDFMDLVRGTSYKPNVELFIRTIEQAYVKTANGTFESSSTGERFSLREANDRFNNEIEDFKNKSHKGLMHLGAPSPILKACGVNVEEITLSPKVLNKKLNQHSLTSDDVRDLVNAIQKPIMVYKHGEKSPNIVVITNADVRGNKLSLALELDADGNVTELNNVSSIHDKDAETEVKRWLSWNEGYLENALRWVDKEKVSDWLSSARLNSYSQTEYNQKLSSVAKVLNNFENPSISEENLQDDSENVRYSLRQKPEPTKKGIGYKVFVLKDGKLYPPMVANPNGAATPVGLWLDADAAPIAGESKTGRPQVKQGGKGTQGGSGKLAYRPGWHLGVIPYALQFNRKDAEGNKTLFPANFVFAEVEYAADKDYQEEARQEGINANGKYQHSLAGLKHLPTDGYYMYRTNPNPETDPWVITGAMKVNRILTRAEQAELVKKAGRVPQQIQEGDIVTDEIVNRINLEIASAPKFSLKVYHGSGADFTEFDFNHMGEGAGSQAFGWGGYVTSSKKIGKSYATMMDNDPSRSYYRIQHSNGTRFAKKYPTLESFLHGDKRIAQNDKFTEQEKIDYYNEMKKLAEPYHNFYEVNIPDDNGKNYLDWDAKAPKGLLDDIKKDLNISDTDAEHVLSQYDNDGEGLYRLLSMFSGNSRIGSDKEASNYLSNKGFVGIKYKAGRNFGGAEEGDINYVIFKPEDMKITEHTKFSLKNAKPVRFEAGKQLSEDEKKEVLSTLKDAYKVNGVPFHIEETANGKEKRVYEPTADSYVVSDITNRPLRYYITLPDGRVAHPSEVYPNISNSEVNSSAEKQGVLNDEAELIVNGAVVKLDDANVDNKKALDILTELQKLPHKTHDVGYGLNNAQSYDFKTGVFTSNADQAIDYVVRRMRRKGEVSDDVVKAVKKAVADSYGMVDNLVDWLGNTKFSLKTDNQGNPLNADGTLKLDKVKSVDELTDEDFLHPVRNVQMPTLSKKVADAIGTDNKPVIIKKNIFERNYKRHKDVTPEQSKAIFKAALYNPDLYGQNQKSKRPYNWVLINTKDEQGKNRTVLLEVNPNKDNVEIVHWHFVDERGLEKIKKQVAHEDGQLLILPSNKEEVGALSDPMSNLSAAKIDNSSETAKENGEKFSLKDDEYNFYANRYGTEPEYIAKFDEAMQIGNVQLGHWAMANIRRAYRINHSDMTLSMFTKMFNSVKNELYSRYGNLDELQKQYEDEVMAERNVMETARKKAEEEEAKKQKRLEELSLISDADLDKRYMDAISNNDETTAREMLDESARRKGYGDSNSEYQGQGAWAAPSNPHYESDEARRADVEANSPDVNLEDMALGYNLQPADYFYNPRDYMNDTAHGLESSRVIKNALDALKRGEKDVKVKVYRAVPTSVKEGKLRNGDWVTPSKKYAEMHGNNRLEGKYRIIEDEVPANQLWWDGNDANEFGFDDGKEYKYKNAKNNRKLNDLVTYDDKGKVILPSKRFNSRKADTRFSLKQEKERIVEDAKKNGTYMMAPNGKKSKLNAEQWADVRTDNFKKWFGDWENDAENASKVVDENGEPLVVYHGRSTDFNTFERKTGQRGVMGFSVDVETEGFFFSPNRDFSEKYAANAARNRGGKANVIPCFLNIKNPLDFTAEDYDKKYEDLTGWNWVVGMDRQDNIWEIMDEEGMADKMKAKGYDGAIFVEEVDDNYEPTQISYCALNANQIKSADNNNGDYSADSDDIRYSLRFNQYEQELAQWKKKNGLAEDAVPMEKPEPWSDGKENIFDYMNRMAQWVKDQNLWKTAPKKTGFKEALDEWKKSKGLPEDAYAPVRPNYDDYGNDDDYDAAVKEYKEQKELWADAPKAKDYDLTVDYDDIKKQLRNIRRAVLNQKNYDKRTVQAISDLVKKMLTVGWGDGLSRGKVARLLSAAKNATGATDVRKHIDNALGVLADNYLHRLETAYDNLIKTKGAKADQSGVIKIGSLDPNGQNFLREYKKAMTMDDKTLDAYISDIENNSAKYPEYAEQNQYRLAGIQAAILFKQQIGGNDADIAELENQIRMLKDKPDATKEDKELLKAMRQKLFENKFDRITMYENLLSNIQGTISDSKSKAKEFKQKMMQHQEDIRHMANIDMEGRDSTYYDTTTAKKKFVNNPLQRAVFSSTYTFEQFLKYFGMKHTANGEGRLYNYFMGSLQDATNEQQVYNEANRKHLDEKASEIFGKGTKFMDLARNSGDGMDIEVTDYSNKETQKRTIHLKQGQMLYIYLVNKETDGQMKLRAMGIDESDVAAIEEKLDPKMKQMGEWLQDEYLPSCQRRYQNTHTQYFGAPMKEVENYFPLVVNQRARNVKEDVNRDSEAVSQLAGTSTGAIVTRRVNTVPLDIENADAFAVAFNHLEEMEEWSAMLPFRQDINTLLSYTHFRNQVMNMSSKAYGSGKTLWDEFKQTAQIAAETYKPKVNAGMMDSRIAAAMGGIAMAKISGRLWTAIKQSQSATVFLPECDFTRFVKNGVNPYGSWKWAMENMPDFRKRVESLTYGDVKLRQYLDELEKVHDWAKLAAKWGMKANVLVDAVTCAVGARSVYETEVSRLTKLGYPKEKAEEKAMQRASRAYNKTQQSSEGAYLSPMQVDRTYVSAALSLFKNANYAYGRNVIDACRGLANTYDFWGGKHKTALIESMTKQIMAEDKLDEDKARAIAKAAYNRTFRQSLGRLINYVTIVPISWSLYKVLPYLFFGDDDDKKKQMIEEAALTGFATSLTDDYVIPFASNILNAGLKIGEDGKPTFDTEVFKYQNLYINPATSDLANLYSIIGNQKWYSLANKAGVLGVQALIGFNPETVGAFAQALFEADYKSDNAAKEWQIGILKAISAPEETIRELYMDELGLKSGDKDVVKKALSVIGLDAKDINKIPLSVLEERYSKRQLNRDNLYAEWAMPKETFNEYVEKYQKSFEKKIQDKMDKWDAYDKNKVDAFFNSTTDPKLREIIEKKKAKDSKAETEEILEREGLANQEPEVDAGGEAYDAAKNSFDMSADLTIKQHNTVLDKRYKDLQDEYSELDNGGQQWLFKSKHPDFKAYNEMKTAFGTYSKEVKELKEKLVNAKGYDDKQAILKQIRDKRDKFMKLQETVM